MGSQSFILCGLQSFFENLSSNKCLKIKVAKKSDAMKINQLLGEKKFSRFGHFTIARWILEIKSFQ